MKRELTSGCTLRTLGTASAFAAAVAFYPLTAAANGGTYDGLEPSIETVCDDAGLSGALWGLCNAYCEAMDCDVRTDDHVGCDKVLGNFQKISLKKTGSQLDMPCSAAADMDGDGVPDDEDVCPDVADADQVDSDGDGLGDACDNCPDTANADQADTNASGVGDVCECPCWTTEEVAAAFAACAEGDFIADEIPEGATVGCLDGTFLGDVTTIDGESVCVKFTDTAEEIRTITPDQAGQCVDVIEPYFNGGGGPIFG